MINAIWISASRNHVTTSFSSLSYHPHLLSSHGNLESLTTKASHSVCEWTSAYSRLQDLAASGVPPFTLTPDPYSKTSFSTKAGDVDWMNSFNSELPLHCTGLPTYLQPYVQPYVDQTPSMQTKRLGHLLHYETGTRHKLQFL